MPKIVITPLSALEHAMREHAPSHLVTLLSPDHMIETPAGLPPERHLKLGMNDIVDLREGETPPSQQHVENLIRFGRGWDAQNPLLVHCWAGISRSTAAAYILFCDRLRDQSELEIAQVLRQRAPHACPNRLMVRLADDALGRGGRMVEAVESIGRGRIVSEGFTVQVPLTLGAP